MTLSLASPTDHLKLEVLFQSAFAEDSVLYPLKKAKLLVIAREADSILGAGALLQSQIHSQYPKIAIAVESSHRRKRIATKLHEFILSNLPMDQASVLGLDGACSSEDKIAIGLLQSLSYKPVLDCFTLQIPLPASIAHDDEFQSQILSDVLGNQITESQLLQFLVKRYSETHYWNPVTLSPSDSKWKDIALSGMNFNLSSVVLKDHQILGTSIAAKLNNELQIIWSFAESQNTDEQAQILKSLLSLQMKKAFEQGLNQASMEVDSTDEGLMGVRFPPHTATIWKRFRLSYGS